MLCIIVGSEALSRLLRVDPPHGIFARELIEHHGKGFTRVTGKDIFQVLRNGLAHLYDTELVRIGDGGPDVGLLVSWESYTHLEVRKEERGLMLVLHVPTMWADLQRVMADALPNVREGDGQTVSTDWKNGRVWKASNAALSEWATVLGVPAGRPFRNSTHPRSAD